MEFITILEMIKDYDVFTIGIGIFVYKQLDKKLSTVDKSVNCRPPGTMTLSQEVSEIHRKVDIQSNEVSHIKKEIDLYRKVDEKLFSEITSDIKVLHKRITAKK